MLHSLDAAFFENASLLMDRAYEENETRTLAAAQGFNPVVPQSPIEWNLVNTTKNCINAATKLNVSSVESRNSEESQHASKNEMLPL